MDTASDKATVLAVEDNPDTLTLLRYMLSKQYHPVLASHVEQALTLAEEHEVDLFLLDINLGEEHTGISLLGRLRKDPEYHLTPVLALTAYAMPGDRERFIEMGFDGYVSKPFTRQTLLEAIEDALQRGNAEAS